MLIFRVSVFCSHVLSRRLPLRWHGQQFLCLGKICACLIPFGDSVFEFVASVFKSLMYLFTHMSLTAFMNFYFAAALLFELFPVMSANACKKWKHCMWLFEVRRRHGSFNVFAKSDWILCFQLLRKSIRDFYLSFCKMFIATRIREYDSLP